MNVDPAALLRVVAAEGVSQRLQRDRELDEVVEGDGASMLSVELLDEEIHGGRLKAVTHHAQSRRQLALIDETRIVTIVAAERLLPSGHVVPQLGEFLKIDGAGVVTVEHDDHLSNRLGVKRRPGSIGQRLAEFRGADLPRSVLVHLGEDVPQKLRIGRGCHRSMRIQRESWQNYKSGKHDLTVFLSSLSNTF